MTYCTLQEARNAGAQGDDAAVGAAIASAQRRIDRFTGELWEPTQRVIVAHVSGDGATALLHRRVRLDPAPAVRFVGADTDLPATAYRVLSGAVEGQLDAVLLGGHGRADALVVGAEPWRGGYANLFRSAGVPTGQVQVTGWWGHDAPPAEVRSACAQLAAHLTQGGVGATVPPAPTTDDEGNAVAITTAPEPARQRLTRTTGLPHVDDLLRPLVRRPVRLA